MRATILASVLAFTAAAAAPGMAADMPVKAPPLKAPPPVACSWTGWHVGVNAGYGWGDPSALFTPANLPLPTNGRLDEAAAPSTLSTSPKGGLFGAQTGYTTQLNNALTAGVELEAIFAKLKDYSKTSETNKNTVVSDPVQTNATASINSQMDWFGTLRGRLGYNANLVMPYITGGAALGHIKTTVNVSGTYFNTTTGTNTGAFGNSATVSDTRWGTAVGGGIDWAITPRWAVRSEYLFLHFPGKAYGALIPGLTSLRNGMDAHIGRIALNYRFGL